MAIGTFHRLYKVEPNKAQKEAMERAFRVTAARLMKEGESVEVCTCESILPNHILVTLTGSKSGLIMTRNVGPTGGLVGSD